MIKCFMLIYTIPQYGDLKIYKFTDYQEFELSTDAVELDRKSGFFITAEELEQLQREAFEAGQIIEDDGEDHGFKFDVFEEYLSSKSKEVRSE